MKHGDIWRHKNGNFVSVVKPEQSDFTVLVVFGVEVYLSQDLDLIKECELIHRSENNVQINFDEARTIQVAVANLLKQQTHAYQLIVDKLAPIAKQGAIQ